MTKRRLFLHVGLPKCGSTSIQLRMASNRAALLDHGIFYPAMPDDREEGEHVGHMPLSTSILRSDGASPLLRQVMREDQASGAEALCLSSEAFITRAERQQAAGIGDALDGYETSIIAFYRRHDAWIASRYKQAVFGRTYAGTLAEFVAEPPRGYRDMIEFNVVDRLDRLAESFGATHVRVVDLAAGKVDAVAAMGEFVGAPLEHWTSDNTLLTGNGSLKTANGDANISLGNLATLFLRDVNARVADAKLRREIVVSLMRTVEPEPPTRLMRRPMAERLRATFARVNAPLFERHGLSPHAEIEPGEGPVRDALTTEERAAIGRRLLDDMTPSLRETAREALSL